MSTIGIKIANGTYYPIIDTSTVGKKRLVLTTVKDEQDSIQVDLFKGEDDSLESASYIGSLVLENIGPAEKGEPELELIVGIDDANNLSASVGDSASGEKQSLSLSLESLAEEGEFDLPDFDLDSSIEPSSQVTSIDEEAGEFEEPFVPEEDFGDEELFEEDEFETGDTETFDESAELDEPDFDTDFDLEDELAPEEAAGFGEQPFYEEERYDEEEPPPVSEQRRAHPGLLIVFVILGLIIIGLLSFLIYRSFQGEETPALFARLGGSRTEETAEEEPEAGEASGTQAGAGAETAGEDPAEVEPADTADDGNRESGAEQAEPAEGTGKPASTDSVDTGNDKQGVVLNEEKLGGVWYWIRWGDTLWDLSYSFYRTPWLYPKIAGANNIKNPDKIYANTRLFIPEN